MPECRPPRHAWDFDGLTVVKCTCGELRARMALTDESGWRISLVDVIDHPVSGTEGT